MKLEVGLYRGDRRQLEAGLYRGDTFLFNTFGRVNRVFLFIMNRQGRIYRFCKQYRIIFSDGDVYLYMEILDLG